MTARAESIMVAVTTTLTGLAATGANVQRGQVYNHEDSALPALAVMMGDDSPTAEYQTGLIDWELTIRIEATARIDAAYTALSSGIDTALNEIREQVHAALMADHTLGLGYVIDITPGIASEPALSGESNQPTGTQILEYVIQYRTNRANIGA